MANQTKTRKLNINRKAVSAVTLLIVLALSVVFIVLGVTGRKMDSEGLYKLLPWIPTVGGSSDWREALVPGAALGDTAVQTYVFQQTDEKLPDPDLDRAVKVLSTRLYDLGWTDVAVEKDADGKIRVTLPKGADASYLGKLLGAKGEYALASPDGQVFLTGDHIRSAGFGYSDRTGKSFSLSFAFDQEGKEIFAQKTTELLGQSISLLRDGVVLISPSISTPLTDGGVSIPNFTLEEAREHAFLMRSGALPAALTLQEDVASGSALLGGNVQRNLIIALMCLFILSALYLIFVYRLGGFVAAWVLLLQLGLSYFFAALIGAGFTVLTLAAIYLPFIISVTALINLLSGMRVDVLRGRSVRQALKENYAGRAHASLDVFAALTILSIVFIMIDHGMIKLFSEVFAISLLSGLVMTQLAMRLLINETIVLFGARTPLYVTRRDEKKEA